MLIAFAKQASCRKIVAKGNLEALGISSFRLERNCPCLHGEGRTYNMFGHFCKLQKLRWMLLGLMEKSLDLKGAICYRLTNLKS